MSNGENQKLNRQRRISNGLCINCSQGAITGETKCIYHKNKQKEYYLNNKEKFYKYNQNYKEKNKKQIKQQRRNSELKKKYGITHEEYEKIYQKQKGLCFICNKFKEILFVDHSHKDNKVRALLCSNCNTFLGLAKEDIAILKKAIDYLEQFS